MTRTTYRKDDVQVHSEGFGRMGRLAVNVKVYRSSRSVPLPLELGSSYPIGHPELISTSYTADGFTHEWVEQWAEENSDTADSLFWQTCADGWEQLQELAEEIWGKGTKVYSEGRSGGWAVVDGLDDLEQWDAIALGKWRRFERLARIVADDVPRVMLEAIYFNVWEDGNDD